MTEASNTWLRSLLLFSNSLDTVESLHLLAGQAPLSCFLGTYLYRRPHFGIRFPLWNPNEWQHKMVGLYIRLASKEATFRPAVTVLGLSEQVFAVASAHAPGSTVTFLAISPDRPLRKLPGFWRGWTAFAYKLQPKTLDNWPQSLPNCFCPTFSFLFLPKSTASL